MTREQMFCGSLHPDGETRCSRPAGHDGRHGYAGMFWPRHPEAEYQRGYLDGVRESIDIVVRILGITQDDYVLNPPPPVGEPTQPPIDTPLPMVLGHPERVGFHTLPDETD